MLFLTILGTRIFFIDSSSEINGKAVFAFFHDRKCANVKIIAMSNRNLFAKIFLLGSVTIELQQEISVSTVYGLHCLACIREIVHLDHVKVLIYHPFTAATAYC